MSPLDFWARASWLGNKQDENGEDSFAQILGKAYHKRILEGRAAFDACYAPTFVAPAGALDTMDQLKMRLKTHEARVGGSKAELIERLLEIEPTARIAQVMQESYEAEHAGKVFLNRDTLDRIELAAAMIEKSPTLGKAFTGGMPEVSVFWTCYKTGVPCKARFDYLKPKAIIDLKTASNKGGYPVARAIERELAYNRYAIQTAWYYEASDYIAEFVREAKVQFVGVTMGEGGASYLRALRDNHEKTFIFVFQIKGIAPTAIGRSLPRNSTHVQIAQAYCEAAKQTYKTCTETYGTDPWVSDEPIAVFDDAQIPALWEN
jgi:hypothetical protein